MKKIITLLLLLLGSGSLFAQTIYYVKPSGHDIYNGTSWATAFRTVQKALAMVPSGQVWVAAGTYYPDEGGGATDNDRNASFWLKNNVALYGGFAGSETLLSQRHPAANPTILSGEIQRDGSMDNNSYHVVRSANVDGTAVLDGFTITGGRANNRWGAWEGGAGAGMHNYYSSPTISNCLFTGNSASPSGGGMQNDYASPTLTNCSFSGNRAFYDAVDHWEGWGAALYNNESAPMLLHCSFARNEAAASNGYAINNILSSITLVNCVLWDNGKEIYSIGGSTAVSYSLVRGGYPGTGNISSDPLFVDAAHNNLRLQGCSPAINAGRMYALPSPVISDADGNPRQVGDEWMTGVVDMGAYEYQAGGAPTYIFVNRAVSGGLNDGTSWANAFTSLPEALQKAAPCHEAEIWVTADTYYPTEDSAERTASFLLQNRVTVRGGFMGTETPGDPNIRRLRFTTLSGDIDRDGTLSGNAYHVVQGIDVDNSAVLDGFIITGGNADDDANLENDRGAGIYNERSYPTIRNCIITGNRALNYGGGIYNSNSDHPPILTNCLFTRDSSGYIGGAIFNLASSPRILHCTIAQNFAADRGGGICNYSNSGPVITNSILWDNGQSIANVLGGAPVVSYSLVQGGWTGTGNLDSDPLFVIKGYSLMAVSPAINAGSDVAAAGLATDLEGSPRKQGLHVDMGAYEYATTGGTGPSDPLTLTCPGGYTLQSDATSCGAVADFTGAHAATASGGKPPVTVSYAPASGTLLPVGENTITVTATDGEGTTKTCTFTITVVDTTPPLVSCPAAIGGFLLESPPLNRATGRGACLYTVKGTELDVQATDNCPAPLTYSYTLSGSTTTTEPVVSSTLNGVVLNRGLTTLTWVVQDAAGNQSSCHVDVLVSDKTAPVISNVSATPSVLYPPAHKLQEVTVNYTASDHCAVASTTLAVSSNEPVYGTGSGDTGPDWQVIDSHKVKLRAERSGSGSGRIYTITITAKDVAGNESTATTTVTVPHDKGAPVTGNKAVNNSEVASLTVQAVPNPSGEGFTLTVQSPSTLPLTIKVMDGAGRIIEQRAGVAPNGTQYIGNQYRPGVYYLQVLQGSALQTIRLIKQAH